MIRSLTGTIKDIGSNYLVVDVRGVGYLVASPTLTNNYSLDQTVFLNTYLAVRETALDLYGFPQKSELEMFELLLAIPKIGPKSALQIMTQATPTLLAEAAHKNDGLYLHKLSGIGKKTAEKIVEFLNKKLDSLPTSIQIDTSIPDLNQIQTDAIDALVALGYDILTAREVIINMKEENATVNILVTKALKQI
jgi:Holliday junction DNA helicase RuvA